MINLSNSVPTAAEDNETGQTPLSKGELFSRYLSVWFVPWFFLVLYQHPTVVLILFRSSDAELLEFLTPNLVGLYLPLVLALAALTTIVDVKNWLRPAAFIIWAYSAVLLSFGSYFIIDIALKFYDGLYLNVLTQLWAVVAIMVGGSWYMWLIFIMVKRQKLQYLSYYRHSCVMTILLIAPLTIG